LAQMEETLASVGDFISDEDSRRAVEEKVMDDEGAVSGNSRHCVLFSGVQTWAGVHGDNTNPLPKLPTS